MKSLELTLVTETAIPPAEEATLHTLFLPKTLPARDQPTLYSMAGIPGAGKSTFVDRARTKGTYPRDAFLLDPDRVMEALPSYQALRTEKGEGEAFRVWELPARTLAYRFLDEAATRRLDIVQDMGCVRRENYERLCQLKAQGYRIEMTVLLCPADIAISRLSGRDRFTDPAMVRDREISLKMLLPLYKEIADVFTVLDNSDLTAPFRPTDA